MRLFINDTFIRISRSGSEKEFVRHLPLENLPAHIPENLKGKYLIKNTGTEEMQIILQWLAKNRIQQVGELVCLSEDSSRLKELVKKEFRIIKAAGGLVRKNGQFLLIRRLGKWDLPKGKLEKDEKMKDAAVREVEEECGIRVARREKICNTWHSYNLDGKRILKKTAWYLMECQDDKKMKPQKEEGIEEICWVSMDDAIKKLSTSYRSIQAVLECYLQQHNQGI